MTELFRNAWAGWRGFIGDGKLVGLLLVSLLFLWLYYKRVEQKRFLIYATVMTVCCIVPVTAAVLMRYQTSFYGYERIWSFVPLTSVIGYAAAVFVTEPLQNTAEYGREKRIAAVAALLLLFALCGGMGSGLEDNGQEESRRAEAVLEKLREKASGRELCLWAPQEIMAHAREYDSALTLVYGRNMWEPSLNAWLYDTYPEEIVELYRWMSGGEEKTMTDLSCAETAVAAGVNCILLPESTEEGTIESFERLLGVKTESLEGYYLLIR